MSNRCPTCGGIIGCFGPFKSLDELYPVAPPTTPAKGAGDERDEEIAALKKTARTMLGDIEVLNWEEADDDKIAELQQKWWGYKKDALRYRWLRDSAEAVPRVPHVIFSEYECEDCGTFKNKTLFYEELDAAIDAAIRQKEPTK